MSKILIIDDDGLVRDALAVFLVRAGHAVITSADGANGCQAFKNELPDLVILDRILPLMTGSAVLRKIRESSKTIPVIVLTGFENPGDAERYLKAGASSFLSKMDGLSQVLHEAEKLLGLAASGEVRPQAFTRRSSFSTAAGRAGFSADGGPGWRKRGEALPGAKYPERVPPRAEHAMKTILVVDDERSVRRIIRRFLEKEGYSVTEAVDGLEALAAAKKARPDLVLLDIYMPKRGGIEVLTDLKALYPDLDVIMITGNEDEEMARKCLESGARDYVSKPVKLDALGVAIKACLL